MQVRDHFCEMVMGERRKMYAFSEEKDKGLKWEPSAAGFKHHNLSKLRIYGRIQAEENIARLDNIVRFVRNIMEAAVNLEDIKFWKSPVCENCKHTPQEWTLKQKSELSHKLLNMGMLCSHVRVQFPVLGKFHNWSNYLS